MSPPSLFPTAQRFPIPLPVMTSLDQSEASICAVWAHFTTYRVILPITSKQLTTYIVIIRDLPQTYILTIKGQIMGNFH